MTTFLLLVKVAIEAVVLDFSVVRPRRAISEGHFHNSKRHQHNPRLVTRACAAQVAWINPLGGGGQAIPDFR